MNTNVMMNEEKENLTLGWIIYLSIVLFVTVVGVGLDCWYVKKQRSIFERKPDEYLIHE